MGASDFLKVAAGQLRRASQVLKQEAQGMLAERERTARQRSSEISSHQNELKLKQIRLADPNADPRQKQITAKEVQNLQKAIEAKKREVDQVTQRLSGAAQSKQNRAGNLEGRARELESQASSPEMA